MLAVCARTACADVLTGCEVALYVKSGHIFGQTPYVRLRDVRQIILARVAREKNWGPTLATVGKRPLCLTNSEFSSGIYSRLVRSRFTVSWLNFLAN